MILHLLPLPDLETHPMEIRLDQKDLLFHAFHLDQPDQKVLPMENIRIESQDNTLTLTLTDAAEKEILFHPNRKDLQITIRPVQEIL